MQVLIRLSKCTAFPLHVKNAYVDVEIHLHAIFSILVELSGHHDFAAVLPE